MSMRAMNSCSLSRGAPDDTPNQIRIDVIPTRFAGNQRIVSMNPVLVEKIETDCGHHEEREEDDDESLHSVKSRGQDNLETESSAVFLRKHSYLRVSYFA